MVLGFTPSRRIGSIDKFIPTNLDQFPFNQWLDQNFQSKLAEREAAHTPSLAIIATKGTLDWAYPLFILASTASALGVTCRCFSPFMDSNC